MISTELYVKVTTEHKSVRDNLPRENVSMYGPYLTYGDLIFIPILAGLLEESLTKVTTALRDSGKFTFISKSDLGTTTSLLELVHQYKGRNGSNV